MVSIPTDRRDHHGFDVAKPQHLLFGFPLGWQTDVLEMLDVITAGVTEDEALADAIAVVTARQDATGRWPLENSYNGRTAGGMWCSVERRGRPSKWITLRALRTLNRINKQS